jgi:ankyrin repeat protein
MSIKMKEYDLYFPGTTALMVAMPHEPCVKALLDKGADPSAANDYGINAVIVGIGANPTRAKSCVGVLRSVETLLDRARALLHTPDVSDCTPLMYSCMTNDAFDLPENEWTDGWQLTELLLKRGANANHLSRADSPLTIICKYGLDACVALLLQSGVDIELTPRLHGDTPLICSVKYPICLKLLLAAGATVDRANDRGTTALMHACRDGHEILVEALLAKGADAALSDSNGMTALMYACQHGRDLCVSALLHAGAPINQVGPGGKTAVAFAKKYP